MRLLISILAVVSIAQGVAQPRGVELANLTWVEAEQALRGDQIVVIPLTARDLVVDIVNSLTAYGPKRFYVLNTGVSTLVPLKASADELAKSGVLMRFTDVLTIATAAEATVKQQPEGTHADEIYGDATLATREKGRVVVEAMVAGMLREIDELRQAPLPPKK